MTKFEEVVAEIDAARVKCKESMAVIHGHLQRRLQADTAARDRALLSHILEKADE